MKAKEKGKGIINEFKEFIAKGNVLDMAVGLIVGSAFTALVNAVVEDLFTPIFALFTKDLDFSEWTFAGFKIGDFLNSLISFFLIAITVFIIVKVVNSMRNLHKKPEEPKAPTTKTCPYCLSDDVPLAATRCPHCTSMLEEAAAEKEPVAAE